MGFLQGVRRRVSELIGNATRKINVWANRIWSHRPSFDWGRADYAFYDKLWRGQALGLEKSGLIVKPIVSKITAWTLGQAPDIVIAEDEMLQAEVINWYASVEAEILRADLESGKLGDAYLVLNGDGSFSLLPPDIVFPIVNEDDYSDILGWRVNAVHPHPETTRTMRVQDEYYADKRVRVLSIDGSEVDRQEYPNPLGRIPVVHVPGAAGGINDKFGRPEAEALLELLHSYGQILDAGLDGNYRQGRPVFGLEFASTNDLNDFWNRYGKTETQEASDGTTESNTYLDVDLEGIVTFANAKAEFKSPQSSSVDTMNFLQILYYLIVEHTELPEFLLGSAIQGSKASAETQMPPFVKFIELRQKMKERWVIEVIELGVAYQKTIMMRRVAAQTSVSLKWSALTDEDNRLTLDTLKWAYASGLVDDENAVRLMPLDIDDPEGMLKKLRAQSTPEDEGEAFDAAMARDAQMLGAGNVHYVERQPTLPMLREQGYDEHVMVAFRIPIDVADTLASDVRFAGLSPVDPMEMHITLAYLGHMDDVPVSRSDLLTALERMGDSADIVSGLIAGFGRFNASTSSDGQDVLYASFDSSILPKFRERLVDVIEATGANVNKLHGFTPHITLAYVQRGTDTPNFQIETMPLQFDRVTLYWGEEQVDIPLRYRANQNGLVDKPAEIVLSNS